MSARSNSTLPNPTIYGCAINAPRSWFCKYFMRRRCAIHAQVRFGNNTDYRAPCRERTSIEIEKHSYNMIGTKTHTHTHSTRVHKQGTCKIPLKTKRPLYPAHRYGNNTADGKRLEEIIYIKLRFSLSSRLSYFSIFVFPTKTPRLACRRYILLCARCSHCRAIFVRTLIHSHAAST